METQTSDLTHQIGSAALDDDLDDDPALTLSPLRAQFGQLHTYCTRRVAQNKTAQRTREANAARILAADDVLLDLGFGIQWTGPLQGSGEPRAGMTVTSQRQRRDWGVTYHFSPCAGSSRRRYTFVGRVDRVIDGDTLLVTAGRGFEECTAGPLTQDRNP